MDFERTEAEDGVEERPSVRYYPFTLYNETIPLQEVFLKKAAKELQENSRQISQHLESLRRWYHANPSLRCPIGDFSD